MELDARGLKCPLPILKVSKALKELAVGAELTVVADDKGFAPDVRAWCDKTGHTLVALEDANPARIVAVVRRVK